MESQEQGTSLIRSDNLLDLRTFQAMIYNNAQVPLFCQQKPESARANETIIPEAIISEVCS